MALIQRGPGNLDPFLRALKALEDLGWRTLVVEAPGQEHKIEAAKRRGDTFPAGAVREAVKSAMEEVWGEDYDDPDDMRDACTDAIEESIRDVILSGQVEGPARTQEWIERKGNDTNLLGLTGDLASAIVARAER